MKINHPSKKGERGVTILIVAMSLLVLVTMAALAIDVASLYQARAEAQRAADAAALAGAKMFVTSSYTSTTAINFANVCETTGPGSARAANRQAEAAAKVNSIGGNPGVINRIQCDNTHAGNPRVTVT
ncbi:MAG TPA: pilus assembly protein TadG-related protein, partial [Terriglobales bacterium]|nr:pilus assembly protein TadG-related protein [Terriglobales bacterium]